MACSTDPWRSSARRDPFPGLVLTDVGSQAHGGEPVGEGPEETSGVDLGHLVVVADQDQFPCRLFDQVADRSQLAGSHHGGFVNHHHSPGGETTGVARLGEESSQRGGWDPGGGFETGGCLRCERRTHDRGAREYGEVADHSHHRGLAGAGRTDPDLDAVAGGGEPPDHVNLAVGEMVAASQLGFDQAARHPPVAGADSGQGVVDDPLLGGKQLCGGVPVQLRAGEHSTVAASHRPGHRFSGDRYAD